MVENTSPISYQGLRPAKAAAKLGIGLSTVWHRAKHEPNFPKPRKLGPRVTVFIEHELDAYILSCAAPAIDKAGSDQ